MQAKANIERICDASTLEFLFPRIHFNRIDNNKVSGEINNNSHFSMFIKLWP